MVEGLVWVGLEGDVLRVCFFVVVLDGEFLSLREVSEGGIAFACELMLVVQASAVCEGEFLCDRRDGCPFLREFAHVVNVDGFVEAVVREEYFVFVVVSLSDNLASVEVVVACEESDAGCSDGDWVLEFRVCVDVEVVEFFFDFIEGCDSSRFLEVEFVCGDEFRDLSDD